ncbi:MAG: hypothetical protein M3Q19_03210 [Pseudomonadota bacterium]|nr:hypothetical protein [Pseudomonadota bacterium]
MYVNNMAPVLSELPFQHSKRDIVERDADSLAVLRIALPDRRDPPLKVDAIPCEIEDVALPQARGQRKQHNLALVDRQLREDRFGL